MESVGISRVLARIRPGYPFTHKRPNGELKICAGYKGTRVLDRYMNKHEHEVNHSKPRGADRGCGGGVKWTVSNVRKMAAILRAWPIKSKFYAIASRGLRGSNKNNSKLA